MLQKTNLIQNETWVGGGLCGGSYVSSRVFCCGSFTPCGLAGGSRGLQMFLWWKCFEVWIVSFGDLRVSTYFGSKCGGSKCSLLDPVPLFGNTWNMYVSLTFFGESGRIRASSPWRAWQTWPEHAGLNSAVQVPRLLQIPALSWIWVVVSIICLFSPPIWRRFPILTNIFSNGLVSNHQLLVVNFHESQLFYKGSSSTSSLFAVLDCGRQKIHPLVWVFPKIGVPPNHPF